MRETIDKPCPT